MPLTLGLYKEMDTQLTQLSRIRAGMFDRVNVEDRDELCITVHALWAGDRAAVYFTCSTKALVVRHGRLPLTDEDYAQITHLVTQTCADTGIQTVLIDCRAAPAGCQCVLCVSQDVEAPTVLALRQASRQRMLQKALRRFHSFESAVAYVTPKKPAPSTAPCPGGFERIFTLVTERGGRMIFGNYAGALLHMPRESALVFHWSGDESDDYPEYRLFTACEILVKQLGVKYVIVDHRNLVDFSELLVDRIRQIVMNPLARPTVTNVISIGEWPWKFRDAMEWLRSNETRIEISDARSMREAIEGLGARSRARRRLAVAA